MKCQRTLHEYFVVVPIVTLPCTYRWILILSGSNAPIAGILFRFLPNGLPEDRPIDKDIGFGNRGCPSNRQQSETQEGHCAAGIGPSCPISRYGTASMRVAVR